MTELEHGSPRVWRASGRRLSLETPRIMGILNTTPDSFSDGGLFLDPGKAVAHGLRLLDEGADMLDIGGMSTRPGAAAVSDEDERARVVPVIREIRAREPHALLSVDTMKQSVAEAALEAGADIINDIRGLRDEPQLAALAAKSGAGLVLMHSSGTPDVMQTRTDYPSFPGAVVDALSESIQIALTAGVEPEQIVIDPGFGFGKTAPQCATMLQELEDFHALGYPVLCGVSRKSFLGWLTGREKPEDRDVATHVVGALAVLKGAKILRVHDVAGARDSLAALAACGTSDA